MCESLQINVEKFYRCITNMTLFLQKYKREYRQRIHDIIRGAHKSWMHGRDVVDEEDKSMFIKTVLRTYEQIVQWSAQIRVISSRNSEQLKDTHLKEVDVCNEYIIYKRNEQNSGNKQIHEREV